VPAAVIQRANCKAEDERIPWIEGYKLSKNQKTGQDIGDMAKRVMAVNVSSEST
jgi:hypothetical protein